MNTLDKLLVTYEGQQHWIPQQIAGDDNLLRQLLSSISPELANADVKRLEGKIEIVPRRGTKGIESQQVLAMLDAAPTEIDPAVVLCCAIQQLELREGINPNRCKQLNQQIEKAITQSQQWQQAAKVTLQRLDGAIGVSVIPIGF